MRHYFRHFLLLVLLSLSMPSAIGDEYKILMRTSVQSLQRLSLTPDQAAFIKQQRQLNVGVTHYDVPPFGDRKSTRLNSSHRT